VFGSDWPVVSQNPFQGISNATTRAPWMEGMPHQKQSLFDTLIAYTRDAAHAEFQEHQKGQIRENYLADLVALPKNIFEMELVDIGSLTPALTMVHGRVVYEA
jgi:predicted amidohydrolase YtcJ